MLGFKHYVDDVYEFYFEYIVYHIIHFFELDG
jgi:hypothetical protein